MSTLNKKKTANNTASTGQTFTDAERAAMKERALELKGDKKNGLSALLAKIDEMPNSDKSIAKKLHELITAIAPQLSPKTWYGMPAYANKEGKVVCFFQGAHKFQARYATLGFSDSANLDEGSMWPTSFAVKKLNASEEETIRELIKKAVS